MKKFPSTLFLTLALCCLGITAIPTAGAQLTGVAEGKNPFTLIVPTAAPASVQNAALELQKDIELATGAHLSLQKDSREIKALSILGQVETVYKSWDQPFPADMTTCLLPGENALAVQVTNKSDKLAGGIFKGASIVAGTPK